MRLIKNFFTAIIIIFFVTIIGGYLSRNFIVKKILESELTELNKGVVNIEKVNLSLFDKRIEIEGIGITSRKNTMKNFVYIGKFDADYDVYFSDRKILIHRANFKDIDFMTDRFNDGSLEKPLFDDKNVVKVNTPKNLETQKNESINNLGELIEARTRVSKDAMEEIIRDQYSISELKLKEKAEYWRNKIAKLENTAEYEQLKKDYAQISKIKNPLKLLRMEKEIKAMGRNFSNFTNLISQNREKMKKDLDTVFNFNTDEILKQSINKILAKGEFVISDFDSIVNFYLNDIYGEKIQTMVLKYKSLMKEVELRRDEDLKNDGEWEFFAEEIGIDTTLYGIELNGEIKSVSSRLSRNLEPIEIYLTAISERSKAEIQGKINVGKLTADFNTNVYNFSVADLKDFETLKKYIISGKAQLNQKLILTKDTIIINGNLNIENMEINGTSVAEKMLVNKFVIKNLVTPLVKGIDKGKIEYQYNSVDGKIILKSDLSQQIANALNSEDGYLKKKIAQEMFEEGKIYIKEFKKELNEKYEKILNELDNELNKDSSSLDKIKGILNSFTR